MATAEINYGWLKDKNGKYFSPRTIIDTITLPNGTVLSTYMSNTYLSIATAGSTYLSKTDASNTYLPKTISASTSKQYVVGTTNGSSANYNSSVYTSGSVLYGAAWNDYAEYRKQESILIPGYCVKSNDKGILSYTKDRLSCCEGVVSDTFGFAIGETDEAKTPLAVAGRVLVYTEEDRNTYHSGDVVCASKNGKVSKMTREEIRDYPDRIVGIVSEIPNYEHWGENNIKVNNRIWIKIR